MGQLTQTIDFPQLSGASTQGFRDVSRLLRNSLSKHPRALTAFTACQVGVVATTLAAPSLNAAIIDKGIMRGDLDTIKSLAVIMAVVAVVNLLLALASTYLAAHISAATAHHLRSRLATKVAGFGDDEAGRFSIGGLLTRHTSDVLNVQSFVFTLLTVMVLAPLMLVGALVVSLFGAAPLTPVIAVASLALVVAVSWLIRRLLPLSARIQRAVDTLNRTVREQLTGVPVTRTFCRESFEIERFETRNDDLTALSAGAGRLQATLLPLVTVIANLATVAVAGVGAVLVDSGRLQIGQIAATTGYLMHILVAASMLSILAAVAPRAVAGSTRIAEVLDIATPDANPAPVATRPADTLQVTGIDVTTLDAAGPRLLFDGVTVHHPGAQAPSLDAVTLDCAPGAVTAVIGGTASGKSTLLATALRLLEPTAGTVRRNGIDVAAIDRRALRAGIGFVGQGTALISGTVADNLRLGDPDARDEDLWSALETADAAEFLAERTTGLETKVAQDGRNFSGGQRQRLALARAVLRRPGLFLLDEPFSALDVDTERRIIARLRAAAPEATVVIASQRVSSVRHADTIAVLEAGRITAIGDPTLLLTTSPVYRDLTAAQAMIDG